MKIFSFLSKLVPQAPQKTADVKEHDYDDRGMKARCIRHLITHRHIDAWAIQKMGSTDARKLISDLRKDGFLRPFSHPNPFTVVKNAKGKGSHRRHHWSGKVPAGWAKPDGEHRNRQRAAAANTETTKA